MHAIAMRFLNKSLVERMARSGIIANVQPQFVPSDLPIIKARVGEGWGRTRVSTKVYIGATHAYMCFRVPC